MRAARWLVGFLIVFGFATTGWWAARTAMGPLVDPLETEVPVTYRVVRGEVGRSMRFAAVAQWRLVPVGVGASEGVITSVEFQPSANVSVGETLLTVDLRPVIAAEGAVPSFRDLSLRSHGLDVEQLQEFLTRLGIYSGEIDGEFGPRVRSAVKLWQKSIDVAEDGVVRAGDIVYLPKLPARVTLGQEMTVGTRLTGGEDLVWLVPDAPEFRIPLTIAQRSVVPLSAEVSVTFAEGTWPARIIAAVESDFDELALVLEGVDGRAVCGSECPMWVALGGRTDFQTDIIVEPRVSGPVVPSAGLGTDLAGVPFVTLVDGSRRTVTILGASNGLAVVDGIEIGESLMLPFTQRPGG